MTFRGRRHNNMGSKIRTGDAGRRRQHAALLSMARCARVTAEALERRVCLSNTPIISEFLAQNNSGLTDENGDRGDWIELYNPTAADINLDGYYLTDSA